MKKRILSAVLTLCMLLTLVPAAAAAEGDVGNFADSNVTWIGTQAEYQKTLDNMYPGGLRKVMAGGKWGIVDATGAFVAPPIYDKIELYYAREYQSDIVDEPVQHIFIDGYTQCIRNGKMGLLNQYGEEVIPAKYAAVGLPSDGVSRIYGEVDSKNICVGYWNLEQGREIVPPNKYMGAADSRSGADTIAGGTPVDERRESEHPSGFGLPGDGENLRTKGRVRLRAFGDFSDGYAFVMTNAHDSFLYGTLIDKNGKEALPGGPYLVNSILGMLYSYYPHFGPYLVYQVAADGYQYKGGPLPTYYKYGVVGPQGVVIPAEYTAGAKEPVSGYRVGEAEMEVLLNEGLVLTTKDAAPGQYNGGRFGVLNLKNQVVLPFTFYKLQYSKEYNLFVGEHDGPEVGYSNTDLYTTAGKKITNGTFTDISLFAAQNGYAPAKIGTLDKTTGYYNKTECFINLKTGETVFTLPPTPPATKAPELPKGQEQGLVRMPNGDYVGAEGKVVFPEILNYSGRKNRIIEGTTLVVKNGKVGYISTEYLAKPTQPKAANPMQATANPSPTKLMVNGKAVAASAYLIGQNNYVKLRDLAYLVNGTGKNFEVTWDGARNAINLKSATKYTTVAGDMAPAAGGAQTATRSSSTVYVDGLGRSFTAYTINGNNYFKLRDVMRVFDIAVGYDNATATATLDTSKGYTLTDGEKAGITPAPGEAAPPPASRVNKLEIVTKPKLDFYLGTTDVFHTAGFQLRYWNEKGVAETVTDPSLMEFKVAGRVIKDGDRLTEADLPANSGTGQKGSVSYKGLTASMLFWIYKGKTVTVDPAADGSDQVLTDGKYTLSVLGNTVGITKGGLVLDSKNPAVFDVEKNGAAYYISAEGKYLAVTHYLIAYSDWQLVQGKEGKGTAAQWVIKNLGGNTYSVRPADNQQKIVNASGQSSQDGTPIIVWDSKDAPPNAIFTFTPAK